MALGNKEKKGHAAIKETVTREYITNIHKHIIYWEIWKREGNREGDGKISCIIC